MKLSPRLVVGVATAMLVAACGASTDETTTTATSTTTPAPTTTSPPDESTTTSPSADAAEGSGCTPGTDDLPDGTWFGLVVSTEEALIEFDLACWFTGEASIVAAAEDGEESPPPNDYYVRNLNTLTRSVTVADNANVVWYTSGDPNSDETGSFAQWLAATQDRGFELGVWLEVENGEIISIQEQWVP